MCWSSYERERLVEIREQEEREPQLPEWKVEAETDVPEEAPVEEPERELVRV